MSATPKIKAKDVEPDRAQNIQVFVRCRPLNHQEKAGRSTVAVEIGGQKEVLVKGTPLNSITKTYQFDRAFGPNSSQTDVYSSVVAPLIDQVLQGYNCTVFAYGQTGTGKTFTMEGGEGKADSKFDWETDPKSGIIPRALSQIFDDLRSTMDTEFSVRISFLELYNEEIFDLLSPVEDLSKLRLYEDATKRGSVIIQGLEEIQVHNKKQVFQILDKGSQKRRTAETLMNATSSRSHTVFTVTIHIKEASVEGEEVLRIGKLNLVDLAGSENIGRSGAVAGRAREAGNINQSLLTLGRVITCLVERSPHIPYRESKLTRLLQDSLGGRTKTSIIATISPATVNLEETLSTLDYAHRAKNITNRPELNQKLSKRTVLKEYTEEIERLRKELFSVREQQGVYIALDNYQQMISEIQSQQKEIVEKLGEMRALKEEMDRKTKSFLDCEEQLKANREELERSREQLSERERVLAATRVVLHQTIQEKELQQHLVSKHVETEVRLGQQARKLLVVADDTNRDVAALLDKLDRTRSLMEENEAAKGSFRESFAAGLDRLLGGLTDYESAHTAGCRQLAGRVDESLGEGVAALGRLAALVDQLGAASGTALGQLEQTVREQGTVSKRLLDERTASQSAGVADLLADGRQLEQEAVGPALAALAVQLDQQAAALSSLETTALKDLSELKAEFLRAAGNLTAHIIHIRKEVEEKVAGTTSTAQRMDTLNTTTTASIEMVKAALEALMSTYNRHFNLVTENIASQQDLQRDLGRSVSALVSEAAATSSRHAADQVAVTASMAADTDSRLDGLSAVLAGCQTANEKSGQLTSELAASAQAATDRQLTTVAAFQAEAATWTGQLRATSEATATSVGESSTSASAALSAQESIIKTTLEETAEAAKEQSQRLETAVTTEILGPTVEFRDAEAAGLRQVLAEVEEFVSVRLQEDQPTGATPGRVERSYPRYLAATSPHARITERYQRQVGSSSSSSLQRAAELPLTDDTADSDSVFSRSTAGGTNQTGSQQDLARLSSSSVASSMLTDYHTDQDENREPADDAPSHKVEKRGLKQPRPAAAATAYRGRDILSSLTSNK